MKGCEDSCRDDESVISGGISNLVWSGSFEREPVALHMEDTRDAIMAILRDH